MAFVPLANGRLKKKKKNLFSKLAYKIITPKNNVMDGYHMAIWPSRLAALKKQIITQMQEKIMYKTKPELTTN